VSIFCVRFVFCQPWRSGYLLITAEIFRSFSLLRLRFFPIAFPPPPFLFHLGLFELSKMIERGSFPGSPDPATLCRERLELFGEASPPLGAFLVCSEIPDRTGLYTFVGQLSLQTRKLWLNLPLFAALFPCFFPFMSFRACPGDSPHSGDLDSIRSRLASLCGMDRVPPLERLRYKAHHVVYVHPHKTLFRWLPSFARFPLTRCS